MALTMIYLKNKPDHKLKSKALSTEITLIKLTLHV